MKGRKNMNYIRIPRSLIYDKELGDKRILLYSSLLFHCWEHKKCDLDELSRYCGFCINRHNDSNTNAFAELIHRFSNNGYITIKKISNKIFTFDSQLPMSNFGIIYEYEFAQIFEYRNTQKKLGLRINHSNLILLLSYLRINMQQHYQKPVMHFSMIKTISENTGMSTRSITLSLKILEQLSIIHCETLPRYKDQYGKWHTNIKIFVNIKNVKNITDYDWR